jgi:hypothetical protein
LALILTKEITAEQVEAIKSDLTSAAFQFYASIKKEN